MSPPNKRIYLDVGEFSEEMLHLAEQVAKAGRSPEYRKVVRGKSTSDKQVLFSRLLGLLLRRRFLNGELTLPETRLVLEDSLTALRMFIFLTNHEKEGNKQLEKKENLK